MVESVYLETTIVSALFDRRPDPVCRAQHEQTADWYDEESACYRVCISPAVLNELQSGTYEHQMEAVLFADNLEQLPIDDEVLGVAEIYVRQLVMPKKMTGDALHLAIASVNRMNYLLTWNCRHLANPNKIHRIIEINRRLGLITPTILTPTMLYREDRS